jgi:iron complex transport system substrate-binding protein
MKGLRRFTVMPQHILVGGKSRPWRAGLARNISFLAALCFVLLAVPETLPAAVYHDDIGRTVEIPAHPRRIISLAPSITETLFALGLDREIVGVTDFCNYPEAALSRPKVGSFISLSAERIVSLNPDLILATADGNRKESVDQLTRLGLPVYTVSPSNLDQTFRMIATIGRITGRDKEALALVHRLRQRVRHVTSVTEHLPRPKVFFQIGLDSLVTVGRDTFLNELITLAGGVNIAGEENIRYPRLSIERVLTAAPDIIIVTSMKGEGSFAQAKRNWMRRSSLPAVRRGQIYLMETDVVFRPSPRIVDGLEELARLIHPEARDRLGSAP